MAKIERNKQQCGKTSAIELFKYVKMKSLSPLTFLGKIRLAFAIFGIFLPGNSAGSQTEEVESKFDKYYFIHTINGHLPVKKNLVRIFSSFAAINHKRNFRKILTVFFKFGWFSWYNYYIFKKIKLNYLMQNLILIRLATI